MNFLHARIDRVTEIFGTLEIRGKQRVGGGLVIAGDRAIALRVIALSERLLK